VDLCNCVDPQQWVVSYLLTWFLRSLVQNRSFSWIPFGCSMGVSRCSSTYARLPSVVKLTVCIYIERFKWCMPYNDVANLLVTKMNMIRRNALWLCVNDCCENTTPSLPQSCAAVSTSLRVFCTGLWSSKIWLFHKSNLIAFSMHLHNCRCFQGWLKTPLQSLRALCLTPGGSGSI